MARPLRHFDEPELPSSTAAYFFKVALRRIWSSKRSSLVAVSMIAISLLILGSFLLLGENLQQTVLRYQGTSRVNVYFDPDATPAQIGAVRDFLSAHRHFKQHLFVTREQALERFKRYFANTSALIDELEDNPFPSSFEIEVAPRAIQSAAFEREIEELRALGGIEQVQLEWEWLARLRRLVRLINTAGLVAGGILALAAAFTIASVIRLTMMLYREEIDIMRLVGATERIVRGPFVLEGILHGLMGAGVAVLLLFLAYTVARRALTPANSLLFGSLLATFLPWTKIAALIVGGALAGAFGSWLSVRERAKES